MVGSALTFPCHMYAVVDIFAPHKIVLMHGCLGLGPSRGGSEASYTYVLIPTCSTLRYFTLGTYYKRYINSTYVVPYVSRPCEAPDACI